MTITTSLCRIFFPLPSFLQDFKCRHYIVLLCLYFLVQFFTLGFCLLLLVISYLWPMLSLHFFSLFFQFIPKDVQQEASEHCWLPSIRKMSHAFPILNFFLLF